MSANNQFSNERAAEPMTRVAIDADHVAVHMTHEQFGLIATALVLASFDQYISPAMRDEYAQVRELLVKAPFVGLTD